MMTRKLTALLAFSAIFVGGSEAANILCVFTSNNPSHIIIHMSYARALLDRGHNVTVVTTLPLKEKNPRLHHIYIPLKEARVNEINELKSKITKSGGIMTKVRGSFKALMAFGSIQYDAIKDQCFQDFMHNPDNKFDLMIMGYFISDYQLGLGLHFNCPVIISWMGPPNPFLNGYVGNPPEVAYVPAIPLVAAMDPLTFKGRVVYFFVNIIMRIFREVVTMQMTKFYNDLFPAPQYRSFEEAGKRVSLLLCNSHFTEGRVRPNVPAVIEVGGIQVKAKPDPLPKDLEAIFNSSSEHGVIYLSFGSFIGSNDINPAVFETIFEVLAGLNQTVLWKWDAVEKPGVAPNIHYRKWLPQDDLLTHPNLKLFITHAGKGSVSESQFHGVPMVALPMFADQPGNAAHITGKGFGVSLDHRTMTATDFRAAVVEVLQNPVYTKNIKRFSKLYRDRPMKARETAVYWIEYVIRHKGAYHMQSPLVHLNALQYIGADVVAFLLLVVVILFKLLETLVRYALGKVSQRRGVQKVKAKLN